MRDVSLEEQTSYAAEDADVTFQLYKFCASTEKKKGRRFVLSHRNAINARFSKMEFTGISLDENWLIQESKDLENDLKNLETKILNSVEKNLT